MSIAKKFTIALVASLGIFTIIFAIIFSIINTQKLTLEADQRANESATALINIAETTDRLLSSQITNAMQLLKNRGSMLGPAALGEPIDFLGKKLPNLLLGDISQMENYKLVDGVAEIMQSTATIFVKNGNDFIRISTNIKREGKRAVGTLLSPNGKAYTAIQEGKAFYGLIDILGQPYLTGYEPIRNSSGDVIGIWYVGYQADLDILKKAVNKTQSIGLGFNAIIDQTGRVRMHSHGVEEKTIANVINLSDDSWHIVKKELHNWGYSMVSAYPVSQLSDQIIDDIFWITLSIIICAIALIFIIQYLLQWVVLKPLGSMLTSLKEISTGNLTVRLNQERNDELGSMAAGFNNMLEHLQTSISAISSASDKLSNTATVVFNNSTRSSKSVTEQANQIDLVATAITEMSQTANEVSTITENASSAAGHAQNEAQKGTIVIERTITQISALAEDVQQASSVINELSSASNEISSVLEVIQNIAEQTNLLALNAAIEAARAGEHGRGFAVVADEVRSLASRTQNSTGEIQQMITRIQTESQRAVQVMDTSKSTATECVTTAGESNESLQQILQSVAQINDINTEVVSATIQQSTVADDIGRNIIVIRDASDHNRGDAISSQKSSEELSKLAEDIRQKVTLFKV
jgi:methyl-accepting chemotaxis protein